MSLISVGARSHLDRLAWGNPASQLTGLDADELRALLQMAQAEGQPEVERWVRDAMSSRGIYASHHASFKVQSKMSAEDWLAKAMAIILAGGITLGLGTPSLPTVDPYSSGGGTRVTAPVQSESAIVSVIGRSPFSTAELERMAEAVGVTGIKVVWTDFVGTNADGEMQGKATGDGTITIKIQNDYDSAWNVVHEMSHIKAGWTDSNDAHGPQWSAVFAPAWAQVKAQMGL